MLPFQCPCTACCRAAGESTLLRTDSFHSTLILDTQQNLSHKTSPSKCNILTISLYKGGEDPEDPAPFYAHATVHEATTRQDAQTHFRTCPHAVIISDFAILRNSEAALVSTLVSYSRSGGAVVLARRFAGGLPPHQARAFFARWGLDNWDIGAYDRLPFVRNPAGVPAPLDVWETNT